MNNNKRLRRVSGGCRPSREGAYGIHTEDTVV